MKNKTKNLISFIIQLLVYLSLRLNSPKLCAYLIKFSLSKNNNLKKKNVSKNKIVILLYRSIGIRDIEIVSKLSNRIPEILILQRRIVRLILVYFLYKKNIFFTLKNPKPSDEEFFNFNKNKIKREEYEKFWTETIFYLKSFYKKKLNFVTFAYYYFIEQGLYAGCKNNKIPVKLWNKECFLSEPDIKHTIKFNKFKYAFKFFQKISTYNNSMKKMLIGMDYSNKNKISVNSCPRVFDFMSKKKEHKRVKNLLFLSFNPLQGFPGIEEGLVPGLKKDWHNEHIIKNNWISSYNKVIKILNELASYEDLNITIKRKNFNTYFTDLKVDKRIKIVVGGTAEKSINEADIVIGLNSGSTIEALVNGKYIMVPFFEKDKKLRKYLYKFDKSIIYNSEKKMKKSILKLLNKKVSFPLNKKSHNKTIKYYYGNSKNVVQKYANFLNS